MVIYKITNLINGKIYVGQDSKNNPNYFGSGLYLKKAFKKYGKNNFKKEIIEYCTSKEELDDKEIFYIKKFNSCDLRIGYNISIGGTGGPNFKNRKHNEKTKEKLRDIWIKKKKDINFIHPLIGFKHSEETKKMYSINRKGKLSGKKNPMYGKKHSEESKKNMSNPRFGKENPMYGKKHSEESKKKISQSTIGIKNHFYGKKHSEEVRKKMSDKAKGRKNNNSKKIIINNIEFESISEASKILKISKYIIKKRFI
jgi:group I intron endonuclease